MENATSYKKLSFSLPGVYSTHISTMLAKILSGRNFVRRESIPQIAKKAQKSKCMRVTLSLILELRQRPFLAGANRYRNFQKKWGWEEKHSPHSITLLAADFVAWRF